MDILSLGNEKFRKFSGFWTSFPETNPDFRFLQNQKKNTVVVVDKAPSAMRVRIIQGVSSRPWHFGRGIYKTL